MEIFESEMEKTEIYDLVRRGKKKKKKKPNKTRGGFFLNYSLAFRSLVNSVFRKRLRYNTGQIITKLRFSIVFHRMCVDSNTNENVFSTLELKKIFKIYGVRGTQLKRLGQAR